MIRWGKQVPAIVSSVRSIKREWPKEHPMSCVWLASIPYMAKVSENDLQQGEQKGRKIHAAVTTGVLVEESQVTEHYGNIDVSKSKQNSGFKTTLSVD